MVTMVAKNAGRRTRRTKAIVANLRAAHRQPCMLCGQDIDYELPSTEPWSFSADHVRPLSLYPELAEDPANFQQSHLDCNKRKGNREGQPGLGMSSRVWGQPEG